MLRVGTDIADVQRIENAIQKYGQSFLRKIFTPAEIEYCQSKAFPAQHFAGKFAAKESLQKALMASFEEISVPLTHLEVVNYADGRPQVRLSEKLAAQCAGMEIEVSISHVKEFAIAIAVVTL